MKIKQLAFFDGDIKCNIDIAAKFFCAFFQPQIVFCIRNLFQKKKFERKVFFLCVQRSLGYTNIGFFFQKHWKFPFFLACLYMPWSMSGNLQTQILKLIIFQNFCQKFTVWYFRYIICERRIYDISGRLQNIFNAREVWLSRFCHLCLVTSTNQKILRNYL